jgi:hypothetical protein
MFRERRGPQSLYKFLGSYKLAERGIEFLEGPRYSARKSRKHYYALNMADYRDQRYDELHVIEARENERNVYLDRARKVFLMRQRKIRPFD